MTSILLKNGSRLLANRSMDLFQHDPSVYHGTGLHSAYSRVPVMTFPGIFAHTKAEYALLLRRRPR